jgi:3-deoxy-D-manno-octulosonic-acid transferase
MPAPMRARPDHILTLPLTLPLRLYRLAGHLLSPLAPRFLARRLARGKEDAGRLNERLGHPITPRPEGPLVWLHAASVGECLSILPLVSRLVASGHAALLTTGTVTSAELAATRLPAGALHQFVPLDLPGAAARFLAHWQPDLAIFCESELWPNLMLETQRRGIPLGIANGRMSVRSAKQWHRLPGTARLLLADLVFCLAQSPADAERYRALGAPAENIGNLKFDAAPLPIEPEALLALERAIGKRPVFLAASTHPGEEQQILEAAALLREQEPEALTIIVPRHPARGPEIEALSRAGGLRVPMRSRGDIPDDLTTIYLADTLGELGLFYTLASVAFIGGSLVPIGGHNPIEPAKLGVPILHGPEIANFRDIYAAFSEAQAAQAITGAEELARAACALIADPAARATLAANARAIAGSGEGALDKTCNRIENLHIGARSQAQGAAPR